MAQLTQNLLLKANSNQTLINKNRYYHYYTDFLTQQNKPITFTHSNFEQYITWRYYNSTIISKTIKKEVGQLFSVARYHNIELPTSKVQTQRYNDLYRSFAKGRGILNDSIKAGIPFQLKEFTKMLHYTRKKSHKEPVWRVFHLFLSLATFGMLRASEYTTNKNHDNWQQRIPLHQDIKIIKADHNMFLQLTLRITKTHQRSSVLDTESTTVPCVCHGVP